MMDAENYAKAVKNANDKDIKETQLTTDGVEDFGYGGRGMGGGDQQQQDQQQQQNENQQGQEGQGQDNARARQAVGNVSWSRDSKKFALVRRDSRKIPKLWVINALANPRPTLETYNYAMPGEANTPQSRWRSSTWRRRRRLWRRRRRLRIRRCRSRWIVPARGSASTRRPNRCGPDRVATSSTSPG